jgi:quercetin dioxygenase-like cupin family protein
MPVYDIKQLKEEFVTPRHSSAFGSLITGEQIELGLLRYKAGEGAKEHAHPQEQILLLLKGRARLTLGAEVFDLGPGQAAHIPPHLPHSLSVLEDAEVVSVKSIVGGAGHRI